MQKIALRQYLAEPGETVTVEVKAAGTRHLVNFFFTQNNTGPLPEGQNLQFGLTGGQPRRTLRLNFTFSNENGGEYNVELSGDAGGDPDTDHVTQDFGIPTTRTRYEFTLNQ